MYKSIYDDELLKLNELTWLPWIGENYASLANDKKILLIGESHYYTEPEHIIQEKDKNFTRLIVQEMVADDKSGYNLFRNAMKLLTVGSTLSQEKKIKLWSNIAFYNFVQRMVEKNKGRPSAEDFSKAWLPFFELIKVIKPAVCIFLGTTSANSLMSSASSIGISSIGKMEIEVIIREGAKRGYKAKKCSFVGIDNQNIELIFVRHPSKYFSIKLWNKYLQSIIPAQLSWLNDFINS